MDLEEAMRMFLFMTFFRLTWWIAPDKKRVDQLFNIYLHLLEMENQKKQNFSPKQKP